MSVTKSATTRLSIAFAAAACLAWTGAASAITFNLPGYTQTSVAPLPAGQSNHFGGVVEGADGNAYVVGGFRPDAYRITPGGTVTPLVLGASATLLGVGIVGNTLYAGQDSGRIDTFDISLANPPATMLTTVPNVNGNGNADFALAPPGFGAYGGQLIASDGGVYAVNPSTGAKSNIFVGSGDHYSALDFGPNGVLYVADYDAAEIYTLSAAGVMTPFASVAGTSPDGLAVHPGTGDIYVADSQNGAILKITPAGVVSTFATGVTLDGGYYPSGFAFSRDGSKLYYLTNLGSVELVVINGFAGGPPPSGVVTPVPTLSPMGWMLLVFMVGVAGFVGVRRRA